MTAGADGDSPSKEHFAVNLVSWNLGLGKPAEVEES